MELKKNPKADINKKSTLFLNIGLFISISLVFFAFEYKFYDDGPVMDLGTVTDDMEEIMEIPPTEQPPPPPPKVKLPEIIEIPDEEEIEEEIELDLDMDMSQNDVIQDLVFEEEVVEEEVDKVFTIVEQQAEPAGGIQAFYDYVGTQLSDKYPRQAQRMGIEGVVYVQFVIERDGSLTDVKAVKGIGGGCDEVAVEVVKNAPKWIPGKQRGRAVRSQRVIPIRFVLN
ncbi:energy transducer TonB [Marivirga sp.]|uniref:energy transducer TonB n=1 Tax=Marivirga sp. TaxID=2018662 RepID=UPI002D7F7D7E|nr:energy transducer TonB [Marivirga sp.]HET8860763.1 energy transducer TonB [Marivirga sp.]